MTDKKLISGKWQGTYTQKLKEDPEDDKILEVAFEMELISAEGGFTGTCYDLEIELGKKEESYVSGFIDGEMISFIKRYEHTIYINEEAEEFILYKEAKHPEIHYYGRFNDAEERFEGNWEIEMDNESIGDDLLDTHLLYGSWWMELVSPSFRNL